MEEKAYKLLKDLPDLPAGAVFTQDGIASFSGRHEQWFTHTRNGGDGKWVYAFDEESILRNTDWFKQKT